MEFAVPYVEAPDEREFRAATRFRVVLREETNPDELLLVVGEEAEREDERQAREGQPDRLSEGQRHLGLVEVRPVIREVDPSRDEHNQADDRNHAVNPALGDLGLGLHPRDRGQGDEEDGQRKQDQLKPQRKRREVHVELDHGGEADHAEKRSQVEGAPLVCLREAKVQNDAGDEEPGDGLFEQTRVPRADRVGHRDDERDIDGVGEEEKRDLSPEGAGDAHQGLARVAFPHEEDHDHAEPNEKGNVAVRQDHAGMVAG